jgi:hypothetical protein
LQQVGVDHLLNELDEKDPPHVEHSFIARDARERLSRELAQVSVRLATLERYAAWFRLIAYAIGVAIFLWIIEQVWLRLPENIQGKIAEGAAKEIIGVLLVVVPFAFKGVRKTIGLALLGKRS